MKPIFNSLGSNYDFNYVLNALTTLLLPDSQAPDKLASALEEKYHAKATLTYKGRDAIEYGLTILGIGVGDQVITQAFTCHAIEEAITRTGATSVFADLEKNALNPSITTLTAALHTAQNAKAVLIQNTLGYPADIKHIATWCHQHHLYLIEDLAQSMGAELPEGTKVGSFGDIVIHSFGRDKIIDAVSGGALVIRNSKILAASTSLQISEGKEVIANTIILKDMLYPLFTWIIRRTHNILIGKMLQRGLVILKLIQNPILSPTTSIKQISNQHATLALLQLTKLNKQLKHRRQIATIYQQLIDPKLLITQDSQLTTATHLRFPIVTDNPTKLIIYLKSHNIHLSDRWYRKAVDFGKLNKTTTYQPGSCPNAEYLAAHMINLPTHQEITVKDAERICRVINQFIQPT